MTKIQDLFIKVEKKVPNNTVYSLNTCVVQTRLWLASLCISLDSVFSKWASHREGTNTSYNSVNIKWQWVNVGDRSVQAHFTVETSEKKNALNIDTNLDSPCSY